MQKKRDKIESRLGAWLSLLSEFRIGLAMVAAVFALFFADFSILEELSLKIFDLNFKAQGVVESRKDVVIVAIDQKSQEKFGRWPWSRMVMVDLINRLNGFKPVAIGLDMVFSYSEKRPDLVLARKLMERLEKKTSQDKELFMRIKNAAEFSDVDKRLAEAFKNAGNVVPGYFFFMNPEEVKGLGLNNKADYRIIRRHGFRSYRLPESKNRNFNLYEAVGVKPNIKPLTNAAALSGHFNLFPDKDGICRRINNLIAFNGKYFPSSAMQILSVANGMAPTTVVFEEYGVHGFYIGDTFIPSDEYGRTILNFYGPENSFKRISIADVLEGGIPDEKLAAILENKIVLVGATAKGIYDIRNTPFGSMAGIELQATFIQNVLDGTVPRRSGWFYLFDAGSILALGLLLTLAMRRLKPFSGGVLAVLLIAFYVYFQRHMFIEQHTLLNVLYPVITVILVYGGIVFYKYAVEAGERRFVKRAFEFYLAPRVISSIMDNPDELHLGGHTRILTAYFSDIQNFSSFAEHMTPARLVELLNEYLTEMTEIIMANGGTLDKYIGDAMMAFFGAPVSDQNHAVKAVRTSLLCQRKLAQLREKWAAQKLPNVKARIGLNTGEMMVGNMGSTQRFDYTIMGDEVNLASRLEQVNKQYGTYICISKSTRDVIADEFEIRELDIIRVVGRQTPVRIYQPLGFKGELTRHQADWLGAYESALAFYESRKWERALKIFTKVVEINKNDVTARRYIKRCETFISDPPAPDWDGVFSMTVK
ncbi:MAG: adenylate/guanylate cyclase domain-containing protein [bacterium]|nr:MAG: adenylate/guanylate cyclase domain-containing protein [bacterium]